MIQAMIVNCEIDCIALYFILCYFMLIICLIIVYLSICYLLFIDNRSILHTLFYSCFYLFLFQILFYFFFS